MNATAVAAAAAPTFAARQTGIELTVVVSFFNPGGGAAADGGAAGRLPA